MPVRPADLIDDFAWDQVGTVDRVVAWDGQALRLEPLA